VRRSFWQLPRWRQTLSLAAAPDKGLLAMEICPEVQTLAAHGVWAVRRRRQVAAWPLHAVAALLVPRWCAALTAWDLIPFALWR